MLFSCVKLGLMVCLSENLVLMKEVMVLFCSGSIECYFLFNLLLSSLRRGCMKNVLRVDGSSLVRVFQLLISLWM